MTKSEQQYGHALPSRLTPMEQLHLLRHDEDTPNVIFAHLSFEGTVDRQVFQKAFDFMVARHEMAVASLCHQTRSWKMPAADEPHESVVVWHERDFDDQPYQTTPVSLVGGESFRCEMFVSDNKVDMVTQIHHAKVDGLGALQGIREILCAYHNLLSGQPIDKGLRRLNPECFENRRRIGLFQKGWWKRIPVQWIPVYGAVKFAAANVAHLIGHTEPVEESEYQFPSYIRERLSTETYEALRSNSDASVNELLLAALFLTVDRFQKEAGFERGKQKLRIMVPVSIRDRADLRGSACNRMAFVQLDRADRDLSDPAGLIWGINYELGIINRFEFEKSVLATMKMMALIPGFLRWRVSKRKVIATTLLTNLGAPFRNLKVPREDGRLVAGNLKCLDVELIPPFYDQTPAVFLFSSYAGQHSVTLHYDPKVIDREQGQRLVELFLEEISKIARR